MNPYEEGLPVYHETERGDAERPNEGVSTSGGVRKGDRVILRPSARGDIFDLALAGQTATVDSIEVDFEGRQHVAVVVDGDPGIAMSRRRPGNRFFFSPDEMERIDDGYAVDSSPASPRILVAGIGNIFLGDDGFGVEVAQRLAARDHPDRVVVADYGIRGYDLAYALVSGYEHVILIDACSRHDGGAPGTLYVIEPDMGSPDDATPTNLDAHAMNPMHVLALARSMGASLGHILIIGCEPATLGPEEGHMGLSDVVAAAVEEAIPLVEGQIARLLATPESTKV